jgi:RND family efflux transporter MFP subunit
MNRQWLGAVLLIIILTFSSCSIQGTEKPLPMTDVPTTDTEDSSISASGEVEPAVWQNLSFSTGGEDVSLEVDIGEEVRKGDVLATINAQAAQVAVDTAQAQLDSAEANLAKLEDTEASEKDITAAESTLVAAESALAEAQRVKAGTRLIAPFDGTVIDVYLRNGETAAPGAPVLLLADLNTLQVHTTDLSELEAVYVTEGNPVEVWFDALPDQVVTGKVVQIALKNSPGSGVYYTVKIELDDIPEELRWGMGAFIVIDVR